MPIIKSSAQCHDTLGGSYGTVILITTHICDKTAVMYLFQKSVPCHKSRLQKSTLCMTSMNTYIHGCSHLKFKHGCTSHAQRPIRRPTSHPIRSVKHRRFDKKRCPAQIETTHLIFTEFSCSTSPDGSDVLFHTRILISELSSSYKKNTKTRNKQTAYIINGLR